MERSVTQQLMALGYAERNPSYTHIMKNADTDFVIIGKFATTYGIHGYIRVRTFTEYGADVLDYLPWYIKEKNDWIPIKLEDGRIHGNDIIAKLQGYDNPEKARLLTGIEIAIPHSQLPILNEDEYYWSDLIGLTVIDQHGETLGKVIYLMETGSNDVLVIKGDKEHAIPFLRDKVITNIDLEKKEIHVNWELV